MRCELIRRLHIEPVKLHLEDEYINLAYKR